MRLIPQCLKDFQRRTVTIQNNRLTPSGNVYLLVLLRQSHNGERRTVDRNQGIQRKMKLSLAAVDHQQIRKRTLLLQKTGKIAFDDLVHHCKVVLSLHRLDAETAVVGFVRPPVTRTDQTRHSKGRAEVGNIEADNHARRLR